MSSGGGFTFGTSNPTGTGFSFGQSQATAAPSKGFLSTPATSASGGGFILSSALGGTATSTGGGTPGGGFSFGSTPAQQTTAAPAMGGFGLGAQNTTTSQSSVGFSLGQSTTATPLLGQAITSAPTLGGFSFGTGTAGAPATTSTSGFSFGTAPASSTTTSTGFSLTPASGTGTSTGFSLAGGATVTPASTAPSGSLSFGLSSAATPSSTGLGGTAPSLGATAPSLGGTAPLLGGTAPSLGGTTGFSFGNPAPQTTAAKPAGFGFGITSSTPQSSVAPVPATSGLGGTSMGLGGAQPPSANAGANNAGAKSDGKSAKKQQLPQDLFSTIAVFETWRTAENSASEENIRLKADPFHKVGKKAEEIQQQLSELASEYLQLHANAVNLKAEVMKEAEHVEMARRTKDTPMALQGENKSPEVYFMNLVRSFEAEMIYCRNKIEEVSMCMQAANNPCETPDDVSEVLQKEHEALKELAAKVYSKHSQLVELSHRLNTKTVPNDQAFFREQSKKTSELPASTVVRPALGGSSSGLQAFQEQQQRAKAVTLGAAPPTMPLAQTSTPSLFGSSTGTGIFGGGSSFGASTFNTGSSTANASFGSKSLFNNNSSFGMNPSGIQQTTSPFSMGTSFNTKPFEDDPDGRRKRRL